VSYDGGTTFNFVSSLSGDVGASISAGTGKHIVWNAGVDCPSYGASNVKLSVISTFFSDALFLDGAGGTIASIPAGSYQRGNVSGDSDITDAPVQTVTLSGFYMSVKDMTKAQWDAVRSWGLSHGYTDLAPGSSKAPNHPVQTVNWFDALKWANAASDKEGLTPCYKLNGVVYRTGRSDAVTCDWSANGYRLPTEAEWEVAARGRLTGKRFPWGDTISQSQANYKASSAHSYDLSGTVNDYHPTYKTGAQPYTSPVGSFAANGYGLYDMAGNVYNWCWDWLGTYDAGGSDPRGATSGERRVLRGGRCDFTANEARCASRSGFYPYYSDVQYGLRLARGQSSLSSGSLSSGGVVDTTAPVLTLPSDVTANATSASGAIVAYSSATASDNVTASPVISYSKASGTVFPIGITPVIVTATDATL
jgi:formylglycine-generating enzyme required for sulfatase activity